MLHGYHAERVYMSSRMIWIAVGTGIVSFLLVLGFPILLPFVSGKHSLLWGVAVLLWAMWAVSYIVKLKKLRSSGNEGI
jgi:hypothetical protein